MFYFFSTARGSGLLRNWGVGLELFLVSKWFSLCFIWPWFISAQFSVMLWYYNILFQEVFSDKLYVTIKHWKHCPILSRWIQNTQGATGWEVNFFFSPILCNFSIFACFHWHTRLVYRFSFISQTFANHCFLLWKSLPGIFYCRENSS